MDTAGSIPKMSDYSNSEQHLNDFTKHCFDNGIKDEVAALRESIGEEVIKSLGPDAVTDKSYEQLVEIQEDHFARKSNKRLARVRFQQRVQKKGESVADFADGLQVGYKYCEFDGTSTEPLCVQFIFGLYNGDHRAELLTYGEASFETLVDKAKALESPPSKTRDGAQGGVGGSLGSQPGIQQAGFSQTGP